MAHVRLAAALTAVAVLAGAGCSAGGSTSDSKIVDALKLKQSSDGYQMAGNPFCTVVDLLNDQSEVSGASTDKGNKFVITAPKGTVGIVARKPFAPSCTRQAKDGLKKLERQAG
jgi:hypothetical protein